MRSKGLGLFDLCVVIAIVSVWGLTLLPGFLRERRESVAVESLLADEAARSGRIILVGPGLQGVKLHVVRSDVPLEGVVLREVLSLNDVTFEERTTDGREFAVAHGRRAFDARAPRDPDSPRYEARNPFVTAVVSARGDRGADLFARICPSHLTARGEGTASVVYIRDRALIVVDHAPEVARLLRIIDSS